MYIITGCAGFIGFQMAKFLLDKNFEVIGIDSLNSYYSKKLKIERLKILKKEKRFKFFKIDLTNKKKINGLFDKLDNFKLIHLAAQPGVVYSFKNPESYYKNNVVATKVLVDKIKKKNVNQFIFISSSSVYGNQKKYPIVESAKLKPINYYASTKIKCEKYIKNQLKNSNTSIKIIRPFTVYGPFGRPDMLILKYLNFIKRKKKIDIYNYGNHLRDFTYIDDVIRIIYQLSKIKNNKIQTFNICASQPIKINEILKYFEKLLNKKISVNMKPKRVGEMEITFGSNNKLKKYTKFQNFIPIKTGLKNTLEWYKKFKQKSLLDLYK
jgi:UDP-glucuronate 4-epimerase